MILIGNRAGFGVDKRDKLFIEIALILPARH